MAKKWWKINCFLNIPKRVSLHMSEYVLLITVRTCTFFPIKFNRGFQISIKIECIKTWFSNHRVIWLRLFSSVQGLLLFPYQVSFPGNIRLVKLKLNPGFPVKKKLRNWIKCWQSSHNNLNWVLCTTNLQEKTTVNSLACDSMLTMFRWGSLFPTDKRPCSLRL